jgi:sulfur-carrier protein
LVIAAQTVREALTILERDYEALYRNICDETGQVRRHLNVFVNADHVSDRKNIDTELATGDILTFLPAVSGGK